MSAVELGGAAGARTDSRDQEKRRLPLDPSLRLTLRQQIDLAVRERALAGVCPWCMSDLPEETHPLQKYCNRGCSNAASAARARRRAA